jgi:hypothetical protein
MLKKIMKDQIESLFLKNSFLRDGNFFFKVEQEMAKVVDFAPSLVYRFPNKIRNYFKDDQAHHQKTDFGPGT